jgi:UDP-N-acetylmuramate: L-alanyl-gamma-D-glutamyl-meso-diaminopimelate ligase
VKEAPRKFHFLGICGTAMGSVAAALQERGFKVTGSDENVYPPMSIFLEKKGIALKEGYRAENIPIGTDVVVIGNAIRRGNPEVEAVLSRKLLYLSLPEVLKNYFLRGRHNLIGGLPKNLGQGARLNDSKYFVIEGDEYDSAFFDKRSKFIHYLPELLIVNNIEFDHADIFNNLAEIKLSFRHLLNIVPQNGMVLLNGDDPNCVEVARDCLAPMIEVGFSKNCAQRIRDVAYSARGSRFKLGEDVFEIPLIGEFNVRNAAMAAIAARFYDVPKTKIDNAFKSFSGIARRQEIRGEVRGVKVIDDFGHHPTAIAHTLQALRQRYRGHRLWAVFEPRSNTTRRAVFQQQLPDALKLADGVLMAQVAKLEQIPEKERLNPKAVVDAIAKAGHPAFYEKDAAAIVDQIVPMLRAKDVVVVFSNGGFDNIHEKLLARLRA